MADQPADASGIIIKASPTSVDDTISRLSALVAKKGMKQFALIDHSAQARNNGLALRDTKVLIFGSPVGGTPVMDAVPLVALDLPLKVLVYDDGGETKVCYTSPDELARRYGLPDELSGRFSGINTITDALASGN
ncbi:MAG TPA: DUF302 domain-containing protein [Solirubrobacteraceae bacterium]|nr:DUF302 domain-containing protein [Solirubrobacteraceae bacterium]